jgi:hypothetical protein
MGIVWLIDFFLKRDLHKKIWVVSPFGDFSPKKEHCVVGLIALFKPMNLLWSPIALASAMMTTSDIFD